MWQISIGYKTFFNRPDEYLIQFTTQQELQEKLRVFLNSKASAELIIHTEINSDDFPPYVQSTILQEISNPFLDSFRKNPIIKLENSNFFSDDEQLKLARILLKNRSQRNDINRVKTFALAGMALGIGSYWALGCSSIVSLLFTSLGCAAAGSMLGQIRNTELIESSEPYDTIQKISKITNPMEQKALKLGAKSGTWKGYLANFDKQAGHAYPHAFRAGLKAAMDKDTDRLNYIKIRAGFR